MVMLSPILCLHLGGICQKLLTPANYLGRQDRDLQRKALPLSQRRVRYFEHVIFGETSKED